MPAPPAPLGVEGRDPGFRVWIGAPGCSEDAKLWRLGAGSRSRRRPARPTARLPAANQDAARAAAANQQRRERLQEPAGAERARSRGRQLRCGRLGARRERRGRAGLPNQPRQPRRGDLRARSRNPAGGVADFCLED
ncbi:Cyclin-Dependent Kinase 12 [Manis pentadactyla]|nr:Cyclin-Dependent Kinase 12 [Manis pentadactyla]